MQIITSFLGYVCYCMIIDNDDDDEITDEKL